jgi:cysteine desulfuration protein SufE
LPPAAERRTLAPVTLAEHERRLIDDLLLIEDPQERLAAIVDRARRLAPLPEAERIALHRVPGCQSRVWIVAAPHDGLVIFRCDADSPLVRGLVALLCELYSGHRPEEIAALEPVLLDELRILSNLSPTRRHGLAAVGARLRQLGTAHLAA